MFINNRNAVTLAVRHDHGSSTMFINDRNAVTISADNFVGPCPEPLTDFQLIGTGAALGALGLLTITGGAIGVAMAGGAFAISQGVIALTGASAGAAVTHKVLNLK